MKGYGVALLSAALLVGCADNPAEQEVREALLSELNRVGMDEVMTIGVVDVEREQRGEQGTIIADVNYEVSFTTTVDGARQVLQKQSGSIYGASSAVSTLVAQYGQFKPGTRYYEDRTVVIRKGVGGWEVVGG